MLHTAPHKKQVKMHVKAMKTFQICTCLRIHENRDTWEQMGLIHLCHCSVWGIYGITVFPMTCLWHMQQVMFLGNGNALV